MKRARPYRLVIYGGLAGLVLGSLVIVGFLASAYLQGHKIDREADALAATERKFAASSDESSARGINSATETKAATPVPEPPFTYTAWGLVGRIAVAQLEAEVESKAAKDEWLRTMDLIPARKGSWSPIYRTQADMAYSELLASIMQDNAVSPAGQPVKLGEFKDRLASAKKIAPKFSEGAARAGAWYRIYAWAKKENPAELVEPSVYLDNAIAEARKIKDDRTEQKQITRAWESLGGELMLFWPLGLTILGTLGAEVARKYMEIFAEDVGSTAAGWVGKHQHPAAGGESAERPVAPTTNSGTA